MKLLTLEQIQKTLPCVQYKSRKNLPKTNGVYFVLDSLGDVIYIGKTYSLEGFKGRIGHKSHHHHSTFLDDFKIFYLEIEDEKLCGEIEEKYISVLKPCLNAFSDHFEWKHKEKEMSRLTDVDMYELFPIPDLEF